MSTDTPEGAQKKRNLAAILTDFTKRQTTEKDNQTMAAAGLCPQGSLLPEDAKRLDCIGYPAMPASIATTVSFTGQGWLDIDFVWSAITEDRNLARIKKRFLEPPTRGSARCMGIASLPASGTQWVCAWCG